MKKSGKKGKNIEMTNAEIQVNEYVRTKNGDIFKVANFYQKGNIYTMVDEKGVLFGNPKKVVKKHSFNLIDLIEVGDYVNGLFVYNFTLIFSNNIKLISIPQDKYYNFDPILLSEENISTIVTKEQMEMIQYVVE